MHAVGENSTIEPCAIMATVRSGPLHSSRHSKLPDVLPPSSMDGLLYVFQLARRAKKAHRSPKTITGQCRLVSLVQNFMHNSSRLELFLHHPALDSLGLCLLFLFCLNLVGWIILLQHECNPHLELADMWSPQCNGRIAPSELQCHSGARRPA